MLPVIALVGRPNAGKSTLFNRLTRSRDALVADLPGLTRDRRYGLGRVGSRPYLVIDTGGISGAEEGIDLEMANQTRLAMEESDHIVLMVDGRDGLNAADAAVAQRIRALGKPVTLAVNKTDGIDPDAARSEFFELGLSEPVAIAAAHGRGVRAML
ncbi:MAG: GTPase, partial [Gammaproteobacteria bacterium]